MKTINLNDHELACEAIHAECKELLPLDAHVEDHGIGPYEFWGAPGNDVRLCLVPTEEEKKYTFFMDWWPSGGMVEFMKGLEETFRCLTEEWTDEHTSMVGTFRLTLGTYRIFYQEELCCCEISFYWEICD